MTKEKLEKEAEEKAGIYFDSLDIDNGNVSDTPFSSYDVFVAYEKGALDFAEPREKRIADLEEENAELKALIEKYRQAVDKCLHITFMGCGCEVNTIGQYATLVDDYLTGVEGLAKWKN